MPPVGKQATVYMARPTPRAPTSPVTSRCTAWLARGPEKRTSPMWQTSNSPTAERVAWCSAMIPLGYCSGIHQPPKSTILAASRRCAS
jgi:hypothetical protein